MSVLHVIFSVDARGGGPIEGVLQQAAHRSSDQFTVNIASLDSPGAPCVAACPVKTFALGGEELRSGSWRRLLPWVRYGYQKRAVPWLRENINKYDIVVVNGLWNYATMAARRALVGSGHPYVVFTHGMLDPWFKKTYPLKSFFKQLFWLFNEGPLLNNANAVLFTTDDEREVSRNAFWPYRVRERVVGYGCGDAPADDGTQEAAFRQTVPGLGQHRYLLFLSRIHPKKGCDLLIEAFASIAKVDLELDLVMAGPDQVGLRAELEAQASRLGVEQRIHWPGMLSGAAKWGAFRGSEAFVLTSHQENFGIVVAEALASGKPALVSDKVQIWREVVNAGAGLAEPDDVDGSKRLLQRFVALSPEQRQAMSAAARSVFLEKFEMSKVVETINAALHEAVDGRTS